MQELTEKSAYSPLLWTMQVLLALKKKTDSYNLNYIGFATCVQTTNPNYDINQVIDLILTIRKLRKDAVNKKKFDSLVKVTAGQYYDKKIKNFDEYGDVNIRYIVCTGILKRSGRGITIISEYESIVNSLAKGTISKESKIDE